MQAIAFDTETHLFGPYNMAPKVVCLSWVIENNSGIEVGYDSIENWLRCALTGNYLLVGHNVAYDMACILSTFPNLNEYVWKAYEEDRIICTEIRERLLDIAEGKFSKAIKYGLSDLTYRYTKKKLDKGEDTWRKRYAELEHISLCDWPKEAIDYAILDAKSTLTCYFAQVNRGKKINYDIPTQYHDTRAAFCLKLMSTWGIEIDQKAVHNLANKINSEMDSLSRILLSYGICKKDKKGNIKQDLKKTRLLIESTYKGTQSILTDKGNIKTGNEIIVDCDSSQLQTLVKYKELEKTKSTYISHMFTDIMHASFWAIGSVSDRTSCSKVNLQNQPRLPGIRECYKARKGRVFLCCDFDSQEMRTLAQTQMDILGKSKLGSRFQEDVHFDPHLEFAASIAKMPLKEAIALHKNNDKTIKNFRQRAKVANFGYPGGMGAPTFVSYAKGWGLEITQNEAYDLKNSWFQQWPEMKQYFDFISNLVGDYKGNVTINQSGFRRGLCTFTQAANTYFQTLAAHSSKSALWEVCKRCYNDLNSYLYGSRPFLFVHDEIGLETPVEVGHEAAMEIEKTMVEAMEKWTPKIPSAASATLMYRWSKEAKRVFEKGRLIPWTQI